VGRRRLGPTRPSVDVSRGSGTNKTSGSLSSFSLQKKKLELELDKKETVLATPRFNFLSQETMR